MFTASPPQQLLRERASILRLYVYCPSCPILKFSNSVPRSQMPPKQNGSHYTINNTTKLSDSTCYCKCRLHEVPNTTVNDFPASFDRLSLPLLSSMSQSWIERDKKWELYLYLCRESASVFLRFLRSFRQHQGMLFWCSTALICLACNKQEQLLMRTVQLFSINVKPLKSKRRLLYLKTQFVPCSKHFSSRL